MRNFTKLSQECILLTQKIKRARAIHTEDPKKCYVANVIDYTGEARYLQRL